MKTLLTILLFLPFCLTQALAQTPPLMNYQGAARSHDGTLLAECDIALRISIHKEGPDGNVVFREIHDVHTSSLGLFTLKIGGGDLRQGALDAVPWWEHNYWLQIEMDEAGGRNFSRLGASQLLTVPYAFHATHADVAERVKNNDDGTSSASSGGGTPGTPWVLNGNEGSNPSFDFIGTTDIKDVVFRTNNTERMRLTAYGKFGINELEPASLFDVGGNMTVGSGYAGLYEAPENGALFEGNVGIGEPYPIAALEVAGEMIVGSDITGIYLPPLNGMLIQGRLGVGTTGPGSKLSVKGGLSVGSTFSENAAPSNGAVFEGKVGIGTTAPMSTFGVSGNTSIGFEYSRANLAPPNGLLVQGDVGIGTPIPVNTLGVAGQMAVGSNYAGTFTAPEDGAIIEGSLGVGTDNPMNKLGVAGSAAIGEGYAGSYAAPENGLIVEGPVGVGVTATDHKLEVLGKSYLDGDVHVTGNTVMNGTLDIDGVTTVHQDKDVPVFTEAWDSGNSTNETYMDASLIVEGAIANKKNTNVGVDIGIGRDAWIGRNLTVKGDGRFTNLFVDNKTISGDTVSSDYVLTFHNKGQTKLEGITTISNEMEAIPGVFYGALNVNGGVAIKKNMRLGKQLYIDWQGQDVNADDWNKFPITIFGANQGIGIKLNTTASNANHFMSFYDNTTRRLGCIQGESVLEHFVDFWFIFNTVQDGADLGIAVLDLAGSIADARACAGVGAVGCPPGISPIVMNTAGVVLAAVKLAANIVQHGLSWGISYQSGLADYAEWLERQDAADTFSYGDIVGVRGGKISSDTKGANALFVISQAPIVLGNMPPKEKEHLYEKCAFLGQVPVKVRGPVNIGDFIIPSGKNDKIGVAVSPSDITADECNLVVGIAWQGLPYAIPGYVNVAVGMPQQATALVVQKNNARIASLEQELGDLTSVLREFIPDIDFRIADQKAVRGEEADFDITTAVRPPSSVPAQTIDDVLEMLDEQTFDEAITYARDLYREGGNDPDKNPIFKMMSQDAVFKADFMHAIKSSANRESNGSEMKAFLDKIETTIRAEMSLELQTK